MASKVGSYCPDFKVAGPKMAAFFMSKAKGFSALEDRHKHLLIKEQCPASKSVSFSVTANAKLYRGSPTSYADWCRQHGFQFADKTIPETWLSEGESDNEKPEQQDPRSPARRNR